MRLRLGAYHDRGAKTAGHVVLKRDAAIGVRSSSWGRSGSCYNPARMTLLVGAATVRRQRQLSHALAPENKSILRTARPSAHTRACMTSYTSCWIVLQSTRGIRSHSHGCGYRCLRPVTLTEQPQPWASGLRRNN